MIVLAAANRVWRKPALKRRLLQVKCDARRVGRRVVLVTKRGIAQYCLRHPSRADRTILNPEPCGTEGARSEMPPAAPSHDVVPNG